MIPTHMLVDVRKDYDGRSTLVTMKCGVKVTARSRADAFEHATAWHSLTTCPLCLEGINHADA